MGVAGGIAATTKNMVFVARAKRIIEEFTCEVDTPAEAREILGLMAKV